MMLRLGVFLQLILLGLTLPALAETPLSWDEVLQSVKLHYPIIHAARQSIIKAEGQYLAAKGAFDPSLSSRYISSPTGGYVYNYSETYVTVPTTYRGLQVFSGYRRGVGNFPIYDNYYETNTGGEVRAGIVLPLLRNSSTDANRAQLEKSNLDIYVQKQNFMLTKIDILKNAGYAYWNWVGEGQKVLVYQHLLSLALERQKALEKRYQLGDAARIDAVENKRLVVQRQIALILAQRSLQQASFVLSLFYRDHSGRTIIPTPAQLPHGLLLRAENEAAPSLNRNNEDNFILHHPLVERIEKEIKMSNIDVGLARNSYLPTVNTLFYTAKDYGVGDPLKEPTSYNVEVQFNFPVLLRQARGDTAAALSKLYSLSDQEKLAKDNIRVALQDSANQLKMVAQQVQMTDQELVLAREVEKAEQIRFTQGDSSIFLVNQREQSVVETEIRAIDAKVSFYKAKIDRNVACGMQSDCMIQTMNFE